MGSTRPDMNWHTTHGGDRDNYPDDRYPSRYPSSMPGRYPPAMYPDDRYPTSPLPGGDRYPGGDRDRPPTSYPYDRYNPDPYAQGGPPPGDRDRDRYPPPGRMPPGMDRYPPPPGSVDPYYPMSPDRYPMMPGGDRYPMMPGADRYPMMHPADRYPMSPDRYPMMPPGADRYPMMPPGGDRGYLPRPGIGDDNRYPPPTSNRYPPPEDDRYGGGGRDPYANKDRYNPEGPSAPPGMYPDTRHPPSRGQQPAEGTYGVRYPDGPDPKYPIMHPYAAGPPGGGGGSRYPPTSDNRFPVGSDRFPTNIYKYGNRDRPQRPPSAPYPSMMGYMPFSAVDMGDRGYGPPRPRPPYAIMVGFGQPDMDNSISDTYGMPYGEPN